ncbi:MAG: hypothetical protein QM775_06125 [Pirellulales bacterium]
MERRHVDRLGRSPSAVLLEAPAMIYLVADAAPPPCATCRDD